MLSALDRAICIFGNQASLAKAIGFTQQAISYAYKNGRVSAEMAVAIERATNAVVRRDDLRPDIFGDA